MRNNVFIFAESRSGSNWLVETLNNHPAISMLKEILQLNQRKKYYEEQKQEIECYKPGNDVEYLKQRLGNLKKELTGCKILFPQIRMFDFYEFINHYQNSHFIILLRQNAIRAEVSGCVAKTHGRWHEMQKPGDLLRIHIDPFCFYRRLEWRRLSKEFVINMLTAYNVKRLTISYEDLFKDKIALLDKIWEFLNVEPVKIKYSNEKASNPYSLRKIIKNFDQLESFFRSYPRYHRMIESDIQDYNDSQNKS
jgi:LPS sulfotransferase NodH